MQLIIDTFGTSVHRKQGSFEVVNKDGKKRISPNKLRSIVINRAARISADAVLLAVENEIEILFVDKSGDVKGRVWSPKYGSISTIRKNQVAFLQRPEALEWVKGNLTFKINAQQKLLETLRRDRPAKQAIIDEAIEKMGLMADKIKSVEAQPIHDVAPSIRGWEGNSSKTYFQALGQLVPEPYRFEKRSKRPATDPFNCVLNYVYGMLYGNVEGALILAGIDPYLGIFHRDEYNRPVLVYDLIERYRVWAEAIALQLAFRRLLADDMFSKYKDGLWLEGNGKKLVIRSANEYFKQIIRYNNKQRSRLQHIKDDAHRFAEQLLDFGKQEEDLP